MNTFLSFRQPLRWSLLFTSSSVSVSKLEGTAKCKPKNKGVKMNKRFGILTPVGQLILMLISLESGLANEPGSFPSVEPSKAIVIRQEIDFPISADLLYRTLLDSERFTKFSGRKARIKRGVGGAFSLFGGHIVGRNLELIPNTRIVQAWRVATWPDGVYSVARFDLKPTAQGTHLIFEHVGFPEGLRDHLAEGWEANYWAPLRKTK
jgi:uncharacterized protein YndB with AHSA1/START domain